MKSYQLRSWQAVLPGVQSVRVYVWPSVRFFMAACALRGVQLSHVQDKEGFMLTLQGEPADVATVIRDFDTRPL